MLSVAHKYFILSDIRLSVAYKLTMLIVIIMNVVILIVVAPTQKKPYLN